MFKRFKKLKRFFEKSDPSLSYSNDKFLKISGKNGRRIYKIRLYLVPDKNPGGAKTDIIFIYFSALSLKRIGVLDLEITLPRNKKTIKVKHMNSLIYVKIQFHEDKP